jgi:aldehyde dehydrogenase (NAD+)
MYKYPQFYIDGAWVDPLQPHELPVINPATEAEIGRISLGTAADAQRAVLAAREAFEEFSAWPLGERKALFARFLQIYQARYEDMASIISAEMGAPLSFARKSQTFLGIGHMQTAMELLDEYRFIEDRQGFRLQREAIGVCALITPWNWPINQIACKVAPALAAGCTMVLKPSEVAPLSACLFTEILHEAGVPPGVFNLVNGDGAGVGQALASHPQVDMVSFTGSTRGGVAIARAAADSVKRVHQELGGKSPNIILDAEVLETAVAAGVDECFSNTGQSCNAPTRMLVPRHLQSRAAELAKTAAEKIIVGDPLDDATDLGPLVSQVQWDKVQRLIKTGIDEAANLVTGGPGKPAGLETGYYVRPTIFSDVSNDMRIAREEIFGPVLAIIPFDDEADALRIANDTPYGLAAYVSGKDQEQVRRVAAGLRAGMVHCNGSNMQLTAPFGGFRQSGNGREWGEFGLEDYLETKVILGY